MDNVSIRDMYQLIDDPSGPDTYAVRVKAGDYVGVIFRYDNVSVVKLPKTAKISFTYSVIEDKRKLIIDKVDFEQFTARVLHDIIANTENQGLSVGSAASNPQKRSIFGKLLQAGYSLFEDGIFRGRK